MVLALGACIGFLGWLLRFQSDLTEAENLEERAWNPGAVEGGDRRLPGTRPDGVEQTIRSTDQGIAWVSATPAARRAEVAVVDRDWVATIGQWQAGDRFAVGLFDGLERVVEVEEVREWGTGTVALTGKLRGMPDGRFFMSATHGRVQVLIREDRPEGWYTLIYQPAENRYVLLEIDRSGSNLLGCGVDALVSDPAGAGAQDALGDPEPVLLSGDSLPETVTLDILAVYTPGAKAVEGDEAAMLNNISQSMLLGNEVHANSDTRIQLNLVHAMEVAYAEENPEDILSPQQYLQDLTDGIIAGVHAARDTHAADFVVFYVDTEMTGGLAWQLTSFDQPDLAFCLARVQQSDWTYTVVHEIGHNMGLGHSATQAVQPYTGIFFPDAAGWQWADSGSSASIGYCSVMTYENFDGEAGNEYTRVAHFSNPDVLYNDVPTGDAASANAARLVRSGRFEYSGFRGPKAVPTSLVADLPSSVDFEGYTETWYQPDTDDADFAILETDGTPSPDTGPAAPASGIYGLYLEATDRQAGDEAHLLNRFDLSPWIGAQLDFSYHMFGTSMGSLLLEGSDDNGGSWAVLWSRSGDQGNLWQSATVDLSTYEGGTVWLRFRAVRGSGFHSDIGLDDLLVTADGPIADLLYTDWVAAAYPDLEDPAPTADPDHDGVSNFLEYAFGMQLNQPDAAAAPSVSEGSAPGDSLQMTFLRGQETVRYVVQSQSDLGDWSGAGVEWDSATSPPDLVPVGETQVVEVPIPSGGRVFSRLEVTEGP